MQGGENKEKTGLEQSPGLGPGLQSGKNIFTFVSAVGFLIYSSWPSGFGSRTGQAPPACSWVLQPEQKLKMAGNRETNDLLSPYAAEPNAGHGGAACAVPAWHRTEPCSPGIPVGRASWELLQDANWDVPVRRFTGLPGHGAGGQGQGRGLCFPSRLCFPDGPIEEAPCGQTAPDPPQTRPVNFIKWLLPPSHPWSRLSSHQGSVFPQPHSGDKFLNHLITHRLNAAALSPRFAGRSPRPAPRGARAADGGCTHELFHISIYLANISGPGGALMEKWVPSAWEKLHLWKMP